MKSNQDMKLITKRDRISSEANKKLIPYLRRRGRHLSLWEAETWINGINLQDLQSLLIRSLPLPLSVRSLCPVSLSLKNAAVNFEDEARDLYVTLRDLSAYKKYYSLNATSTLVVNLGTNSSSVCIHVKVKSDFGD